MHDTFLAADYGHPGDNIPPILAVAQSLGKSGQQLLRGIATGYEIHIDLVRAICLHEHKIDHIAHLRPAQAAGIGTLLGLDTPTIIGFAGGPSEFHDLPIPCCRLHDRFEDGNVGQHLPSSEAICRRLPVPYCSA